MDGWGCEFEVERRVDLLIKVWVQVDGDLRIRGSDN